MSTCHASDGTFEYIVYNHVDVWVCRLCTLVSCNAKHKRNVDLYGTLLLPFICVSPAGSALSHLESDCVFFFHRCGEMQLYVGHLLITGEWGDDDVATAVTTPDVLAAFTTGPVVATRWSHMALLSHVSLILFYSIRWSFLRCRPPCRQEPSLAGRRRRAKKSARVTLWLRSGAVCVFLYYYYYYRRKSWLQTI